MKNPLIYVKNAVLVACFRMRYLGSVKMGVIQSFERIRIEKSAKKGSIIMGSYNQNREKLYIGVDGGQLTIGNHCFFNINSSITCIDKITIGNNCKFGNNLVIVDHDHNYKASDPEFLGSAIEIGNNVWCGANVVILRGSTIGDNCVVGAGSVVKGNYPAGSLICGDRAKIVRAIK